MAAWVIKRRPTTERNVAQSCYQIKKLRREILGYIYKLKKKRTTFKARAVFPDFCSLPENDLVEMGQRKKSEAISKYQN